MKNLIMALALAVTSALSFNANATQHIRTLMVSENKVTYLTPTSAFDTTATGADTFIYYVLFKGDFDVNTWVLDYRKISGTISGSVTLDAAINFAETSSTWYLNANIIWKNLQTDTLNNGNTPLHYPLAATNFRGYRLTVIQGGTSPLARLQPWLLARES